ncbi:MAG: glycerophosphodiester phosphodiesterase [Armatimonadota bacterium]
MTMSSAPTAAQGTQDGQDFEDIEIIAHRGESADAPENTLAAFNLAWERNLPGIELDVHMTGDGQVIVCHDANTKRTTGVSQEIKEATLADLQTLDAGSWKDARWTGEKLPTLSDSLATIPTRTRCFLEIKTGPEAVPAVAAAVTAANLAPDQIAIISFYPETLAEAKRQLPQNKAYFLSSFKQDTATGEWTPTAGDLIAKARSLGADGLDLNYKGPIDADFVKQVKAAGLELYVWTIDETEPAQRMVEAGVDGITSNRADWLRGELRRVRGAGK